jgi:hypothetical protein
LAAATLLVLAVVAAIWPGLVSVTCYQACIGGLSFWFIWPAVAAGAAFWSLRLHSYLRFERFVPLGEEDEPESIHLVARALQLGRFLGGSLFVAGIAYLLGTADDHYGWGLVFLGVVCALISPLASITLRSRESSPRTVRAGSEAADR